MQRHSQLYCADIAHISRAPQLSLAWSVTVNRSLGLATARRSQMAVSMSPSNRPLLARHLVEAHLYLKVNPCARCGTGSVNVADTISVQPGYKDVTVHFQTRCQSCGLAAQQDFLVPKRPSVLSLSNLRLADIGLDDQPSTLIDVGQWLILYSTFMNEVAKEDDRRLARVLKMEAAACVEQALHLYDEPDNDLPPARALFLDATRQRFRDHPELFSRQRLINLRAALPSRGTLQPPGERRKIESEESPPHEQ